MTSFQESSEVCVPSLRMRQGRSDEQQEVGAVAGDTQGLNGTGLPETKAFILPVLQGKLISANLSSAVTIPSVGFPLNAGTARFIFGAAHSPRAAQRCQGIHASGVLKVGKLGDTADFPREMKTYPCFFPRSWRSVAVLRWSFCY